MSVSMFVVTHTRGTIARQSEAIGAGGDSTDAFLSAALCVACQGVRSHPVPVALVGECSMPVV